MSVSSADEQDNDHTFRPAKGAGTRGSLDIPVAGNACEYPETEYEDEYPEVEPFETEKTFREQLFSYCDGGDATYRKPTDSAAVPMAQ